MAQRIVQLLPPHRVYIEPFFGSGAVLFAKRPSPIEVVNDLDRSVVAFFRVLRERPDELIAVCELTPYARAEFEAAVLADDMIDDLERARRFWVRVNQSFVKSAGTQTGWSVTTARSQSTGATVAGRLRRFRECAARLLPVSIECCDGVTLIERLATAEAVVYADPPYLAETRRGRDRLRPADYLHDMGEPADHERLAKALHATEAAVVLSGYPSDLYEQLYGDWWSVDFPVTVHSSHAANGPKGARVERVWSNRALDYGLFAV